MGLTLERLKKKFGIEKTSHMVIIFTVFSLAGATLTLTVRPFYRYLFHLIPRVPLVIRVISYILIAVPSYQCFLLVYGFLLGQFKFFWEREKRLGRWLCKSLSRICKNFLNIFRKQESEYI